MIYIAPNS